MKIELQILLMDFYIMKGNMSKEMQKKQFIIIKKHLHLTSYMRKTILVLFIKMDLNI